MSRKEKHAEDSSLESTSDNSSEESSKEPADKKMHVRKRALKILVFLLAAMIVINIVSVIFYLGVDFSFLKFDFVDSSATKNASELLKEGKCKDGTLFNECSKTQPLFCYNGELLEKAFSCGCPDGYVVEFQGCKKV
jgi:predicted nucleic acid-binding Zn ribbon protein